MGVALACLSGCALPPVAPPQSTVAASAPTSSATPVPSPTPASPSPTADPVAAAAWARIDPLIDQALAALARDPRDDLSHVVVPYAYVERDKLTPSGQAIVDQARTAYSQVQPAAFTFEGEQDADIIAAFSADVPEASVWGTLTDVPGQPVMELHYWLPDDNTTVTTDGLAVRAAVAPFLATTERIVARLPEASSTYDKYRYLAYVESLLISYDFVLYDQVVNGTLQLSHASSPAWAGVMQGKTVCEGYAQVFQLLCELAGLWCRTINGHVTGVTLAHAWNLVALDSGTYFVDVTWADGEMQSGDKNLIGDDAWLRYFMMDDALAQLDHTPSDGTVATGTAGALRVH